jgi:hypothetical protein
VDRFAGGGYHIPKEYIEVLYESLPQRIRDVHKVRGGNTRYQTM